MKKTVMMLITVIFIIMMNDNYDSDNDRTSTKVLGDYIGFMFVCLFVLNQEFCFPLLEECFPAFYFGLKIAHSCDIFKPTYLCDERVLEIYLK